MAKIKNKVVKDGILFVHIGATNIIFSFTDCQGNQIFWKTPGVLKFEGTKRRLSDFAIKQTVIVCIQKLREHSAKRFNVIFSGFFRKWMGMTVTKLLIANNFQLLTIEHSMGRPHGMMRGRKLRRL